MKVWKFLITCIITFWQYAFSNECICDYDAVNRILDNKKLSLSRIKSNIRFEPVDIKGEMYKRPPASSLRKSAKDVTGISSGCQSSQISVFLGDDYTSMVVSYASSTFSTQSSVQYSTKEEDLLTNSENIMTTYGRSSSYSELLYIVNNLVDPRMGEPEATSEYIIDLQDTTDWAYDKVTGEHFSNWYETSSVRTGSARYNNPNVYYDSPLLHRIVLQGLSPGQTYFYRVQGSCTIYSFKVPPLPSSEVYPYKVGVTADIGQTLVSERSVNVLQSFDPEVVLLPGDLSYADGYVPLWDSFGEMIEPLAATVPILTTGGNHEVSTGESWQSYRHRYFTPHRGSGSPNIGYWAKAVGPMLVIALNSYSNMTRGSMQYQWLQEYLSTKIDRSATPWVVLMMHTPFYNSNSGHWKEAELGRVDIEPLLMEYGVDVVIAGHVHSYERIHPVYDFELNDCAPMYLNIGDGGNYEGAYVPWRWENSTTGLNLHDSSIGVQPKWSAFRESSFGVAELTVYNETHMSFDWHRHACMSDSESSYHMNFSDACVTPGDDSSTNMMTSDSVMIIRPDVLSCANRHASTATGDDDLYVLNSTDDEENSELSTLETTLIACVVVLVVSNVVAFVFVWKYFHSSRYSSQIKDDVISPMGGGSSSVVELKDQTSTSDHV